MLLTVGHGTATAEELGAAWMRGPEFRAALDEVLAGPDRTAVMCSESVWWRCHRRMVADATVLLHDVEVRHLMPDGRLSAHPPTDGVRVDGDALVVDVVAPRATVSS